MLMVLASLITNGASLISISITQFVVMDLSGLYRVSEHHFNQATMSKILQTNTDPAVPRLSLSVRPPDSCLFLSLTSMSFSSLSFLHLCFILFSPSHLSLAVEGQWLDWAVWSQCSVSCGSGTQQRQRRCSVSVHGWAECKGPHAETRECTNPSCEGKFLTGGLTLKLTGSLCAQLQFVCCHALINCIERSELSVVPNHRDSPDLHFSSCCTDMLLCQHMQASTPDNN